MKQQLLFDLDDTLIYCNRYFFETVDQFAETLTTWFNSYPDIYAAAIKEKQTEIDLALIEESGFKSGHFPQSFIETYHYFSALTGRKTCKQETDYLQQLAVSVFKHDVEPYPHMENTLCALQNSGHELHLYTGGEPDIQQRKIEKMQLERFFGSRIYIRQQKNNAALEAILQAGDFDRTHTWMIGNSIRTDVIPAITAGIHAIHMLASEEWKYNNIPLDLTPSRGFFRLKRLQEIPQTIERFIAP